jgi:colicin import membrane protein
MIFSDKVYRRSFLIAAGLHGLLLICLLVEFVAYVPERSAPPGTSTEVVQAVAMNTSQVEQEMARMKNEEIAKQKRAEARQQKLEAEAKALREARKQEEAQLKELKKQALAEQKAEREKVQALKAEQALEQKKLAETKREQEKQQKKAEADAKAADAKAKTEAKAKADAKAKAETASKAEAAKAAAAKKEAATKNAEAEKALAAKKAESQERDEARLAEANLQVDKYSGLIQDAIKQNWQILPNTDKTLAVRVTIRTAAGGAVIDVQVIKSSGDAILDRSAVAAVYKASPLPLPPEAEIAEQFRSFNVTLEPKDVIA